MPAATAAFVAVRTTVPAVLPAVRASLMLADSFFLPKIMDPSDLDAAWSVAKECTSGARLRSRGSIDAKRGDS
jgi:hypothetical protein